MMPFDFGLPTRIVCGPGKLAELGVLARSLGSGRRALVVSDEGVVSAGHTARGCESLASADFATRLFDRFTENPTTSQVAVGLELAREFKPELIVGLGGGSSLDCAKGINFLYSCGGTIRDYWGIGKATGPLLPMIAVPTTAGTGSETQSFALISDAQTKVKMACGDKRAAFRIALLDPELTLTQPSRVAALAGFDAIAHAVETAVTKVRSPVSLVFSREAWSRLAPNFVRVLEHPDDREARAEMQWGACLAGMAIENSMLGAAHALANPLTASFGIAHGQAVSLMLPSVVRVNGEAVEQEYRQLLAAVDPHRGFSLGPGDGSEQLAGFLEHVAHLAGLGGTLQQCGVPYEALGQLASDASKQWTGTFNPISLGVEEFRTLYEQVYA